VGGADRRAGAASTTGAVSPSRIASGLGGALPASEFVPLLARLDQAGSRACGLRDALNHDWRRHVVGLITNAGLQRHG
jgi:hypothetical protein